MWLTHSLTSHFTQFQYYFQSDQIGCFIRLWASFLKPLATINLPKSPTFLGNFLKVSKSIFFLVKPFLGNFYRHLAIFFWSHWSSLSPFTFSFFFVLIFSTFVKQNQQKKFSLLCSNRPLVWKILWTECDSFKYLLRLERINVHVQVCSKWG